MKISTPPLLQSARIWLVLLVLMGIGLIVYGNSLRGEFIWDDGLLIEDNTYIKSWHHLAKLFTHSINAGYGTSGSFYRPLLMLSLMLNYSLSKLDVVGYHLTTVFLHIAAAWFLYWLVSVIFKKRLVAFISALFFLIHPIQCEDVAYITGRADSMALIGMLISFVYYIRYSAGKRWHLYGVMLASFIAALLSKENAIVLPGLLLVYHYALKQRVNKKAFFLLLAVSLGYLLLRGTLLSQNAPINPDYFYTTLQRLPGFFVAITKYAQLLFFPFDLKTGYGRRVFAITDPKAITGMLILALLALVVVKNRKKPSLPVFGILWFLTALLPVANIIYPASEYMAERYLYIPSIGIFLIIGNLFSQVYEIRKVRAAAVILCALLVAGLSRITMVHNRYWSSALHHYETRLAYDPDNFWLYCNLGNTYHSQGRRPEAIAAFQKAIAINPSNGVAYLNLANIRSEEELIEDAITLYKKGIALSPRYPQGYGNLAYLYSRIGKIDKAITLYKKAISINPDYAQAHNNLGNLYYQRGETDAARRLYQKAIYIDPEYAEAYNNLGTIYYQEKDMARAIPLYKKALEINPFLADVHYNLALAYQSIGKRKEAFESYKKAMGLNPKLKIDFSANMF